MSVEFPSNATSGVIAGLNSPATYQFQVFANVTFNGTSLQGERSSPIRFTFDGECHSSSHNNFLQNIPLLS